MKTVSLRWRVTWSAIAVLAATLVFSTFLVDTLFAAQSKRDVSVALGNRAQMAEQLARQGATPRELINRLNRGGVHVRVIGPDGRVYGFIDAEHEPGEPPPPMLERDLTGGAKVYLTTEVSPLTQAQVRLRRLLLLVGLGTLAVATAMLVFGVRLALRPLDTMAGLANSIAGGQRGGRLAPVRTDTELGRTAAAFDDMLDALEGAEAQAKESERRTKQFVADAAHELRTPIAGIQAVAEAVAQAGPDTDPETRERLLLLAVRESRRAGRLVEDLLSLAKLDAGMEHPKSEVDLLALVRSEVDSQLLVHPGLEVAVTGTPVTVAADSRLSQVIGNLLDNARRYGTAGIQVEVRAGDRAVVEVTDSGPGVPPADRERIFDRLVRLESARDRDSGGAGLGLAIARGIAEAHGGTLTCVEPPSGVSGALFRLELPAMS
ncbi:sensor histidine kinase [Pseudonocardiaceae bacterium YIM PH 21723]|nr:sensor histidine kinase [Pseudonocardiaceae bacterium YIM PH 21723]